MNILFLVSEKEMHLTGARVFQLIYSLVPEHHVTVATNDKKVSTMIPPNIPNFDGIIVKAQEVAWTMRQRDKFARKFINAYKDIKFPGSDIFLWKSEGFDDYLRNVSNFLFPGVEGQYDATFIPIPAVDEPWGSMIDEFYTAQIFKCKKEGIPLIGLELTPIRFCPPLFFYVFDHFAVKSYESNMYLQQRGVPSEKITQLTYSPDNYALSTIEDAFKHYIFKQKRFPREELNIVLMNHVRKRDELKATVEVIGQLPFKINLFFCLINYAVKDIHEQEVLRDVMMSEFKKHVKQILLTDIMDLPQILISSDLFISMSYLVVFEWCKLYRIPYHNYIDKQTLKTKLESIWIEKQKQKGIADILQSMKNLGLQEKETISIQMNQVLNT